MRVVGVRKHPDQAAKAAGRRVEGIDKLPELLGMADVVVNVLPYTKETVRFFGRKEFELMKRTALFANMGRGITVDENALIEALSAKRIAGAVSDVSTVEPLPADSPLWDADNFLLTSHYSGFHPKYDDMAFDVFIDNLGRYVRGEPLRNIVDKAAGY
jgi:phosphoglycerate dehydrogenase-like enzyme